MSKLDKPLLLWVVLWVFGQLIIGIRNDLLITGRLSSIINIIIASIFVNIILIPLSLVAWVVMKLILRVIKKPQILSGERAIRNVFILWFLIFLAVFLKGFL